MLEKPESAKNGKPLLRARHKQHMGAPPGGLLASQSGHLRALGPAWLIVFQLYNLKPD